MVQRGRKFHWRPNYDRLRAVVLALSCTSTILLNAERSPLSSLTIRHTDMPLDLDQDIAPIPRSREENQERYASLPPREKPR